MIRGSSLATYEEAESKRLPPLTCLFEECHHLHDHVRLVLQGRLI